MPSAEYLPLLVKDLNYKYGQSSLINNINLELKSKQITIILGHNGAGKSLLLKLLHGIIKPSSGKVLWNQISPMTNQYWRAMVLQKPTFFRRSVRYNLEFALKVANVNGTDHVEKCTQALQLCGLENIGERSASILSGGQKQLLSLARAWILEPSVLLLDEPTVALDPPAAKRFEELIQQFEMRGTKIVMTTHDISQAKRIGEDIVFMDQGMIAEQRNANDFFNTPNSISAQNFLAGKL